MITMKMKKYRYSKGVYYICNGCSTPCLLIRQITRNESESLRNIMNETYTNALMKCENRVWQKLSYDELLKTIQTIRSQDTLDDNGNEKKNEGNSSINRSRFSDLDVV